MVRLFPPVSAPPLWLALCLVLSGSIVPVGAAEQPPTHLLAKAEPLPLAIDPAFEFRKTKAYFLETQQVTGVRNGAVEEQSLAFERKRLLFGAITGSDIRDRYGNYYTFYWRAYRPADLSVRFEYRQQKLGAFVQAREVDYPAAHKGSYVTRFVVNGDDYLEQGQVSEWRVLIVENHRAIVALRQSFLWQ